MKNSRTAIKISSLLCAGILLCPLYINAQGKLVDKREQATGWYVPVAGLVTVDGEKADGASVILYKENKEVATVQANSKGKFTLELDLDAAYSIRVKQPGYQSKLIYVDTHLPKDLVKYPSYECKVDLLPASSQEMDPFYSDFPSAIVRYDQETKGFFHSAAYLAHIKTKLSSYASAAH